MRAYAAPGSTSSPGQVTCTIPEAGSLWASGQDSAGSVHDIFAPTELTLSAVSG